jgi:hypothetical protein
MSSELQINYGTNMFLPHWSVTLSDELLQYKLFFEGLDSIGWEHLMFNNLLTQIYRVSLGACIYKTNMCLLGL